VPTFFPFLLISLLSTQFEQRLLCFAVDVRALDLILLVETIKSQRLAILGLFRLPFFPHECILLTQTFEW